MYILKPLKNGFIRLSDLYPHLKHTQVKKDTDYVKGIIQREETFKLINKSLMLLKNDDIKGLTILSSLKSNVYFLQRQNDILKELENFFNRKKQFDICINNEKISDDNLKSMIYKLSLGNINDEDITFNYCKIEFNKRKVCYNKYNNFITSLDCGSRKRHIQYRTRFKKYLKLLIEDYFHIEEVRNSIMWVNLEKYFDVEEMKIISIIEKEFKNL